MYRTATFAEQLGQSLTRRGLSSLVAVLFGVALVSCASNSGKASPKPSSTSTSDPIIYPYSTEPQPSDSAPPTSASETEPGETISYSTAVENAQTPFTLDVSVNVAGCTVTQTGTDSWEFDTTTGCLSATAKLAGQYDVDYNVIVGALPRLAIVYPCSGFRCDDVGASCVDGFCAKLLEFENDSWGDASDQGTTYEWQPLIQPYGRRDTLTIYSEHFYIGMWHHDSSGAVVNSGLVQFGSDEPMPNFDAPVSLAMCGDPACN